MSNALEETVQLAQKCDEAAHKCEWCAKFGHAWADCPQYEVLYRSAQKRRLGLYIWWSVVAGVALVFLVRGLQ